VIDGEPVEVPGVRFRITFEIWDGTDEVRQ